MAKECHFEFDVRSLLSLNRFYNIYLSKSPNSKTLVTCNYTNWNKRNVYTALLIVNIIEIHGTINANLRRLNTNSEVRY